MAVCCPTINETNISYTYDADGTVVTSDNTSYLSIQNSFRYRGYYYDNETGLYYLQSRYYDPVVGRFISADGQLAGVGDTVKGYNLYAYCFNNPVSASDNEGEWPSWAKAVAKVAVAVATFTTSAAGGLALGGVIYIFFDVIPIKDDKTLREYLKEGNR